ncbi:MAG: pyridoxamine 5'-phosphate oxidase family protein [Candidatus Heimdallarchaeota archaeon]
MARMNSEMKQIVENQPYTIIATLPSKGTPHLIVAQDKWIIDDELLVFGRWQMHQTEKNLRNNPLTVVLAVDPDKRRSVRFFGKGKFVKRKELKLNRSADRFDEFLVVKIHRIQYGQWGEDTNTDFAFDHHFSIDHR